MIDNDLARRRTIMLRQLEKNRNVNLYPSEYTNYIQGKRVILVGPAGYLLGQGKGNYINSFDVVVRVNHGIFVNSVKDYGNRTDVLYHILSRRSTDGTHKNVVKPDEVEDWKRLGLLWLISRHDSRSQRVRDVRDSLQGLKYTCLENGFYRRCKNKIRNKAPNTGIVAMMHLLACNVKSLHIVGFDFYRSGVYAGYGDVKENECAEVINSRWHDSEAQIEFLREFAPTQENLFLDEVLEGILSKQQ